MTEPAAGAQIPLNPLLESYYRWDEPESDITVFLNPEVVDQLQLAAWRTIDSDPRAPTEVGGILLGTVRSGGGRVRIVVESFEAVRCGQPLYRPGPREAAEFAAAVAWGQTRRDRSVVGYYRSHNRKGLYLAAEDLKLIQEHFRGPENVFLLIKTLPNRACTAGFFFWNSGRIQAEFTCSEVPLIPTWDPRADEDRIPSPVQESIPAVPPAGTEAVSEAGDRHPSRNAPRVRYLKRHRVSVLVLTGIAAAWIVVAVRHPGSLLGKNAPVNREMAVRRTPSPASAKSETPAPSTHAGTVFAPTPVTREAVVAKPQVATPSRMERTQPLEPAIERTRIPFVPPPYVRSARTVEEAPLPLAPAEEAPQVPVATSTVAQIPLVQAPPPERLAPPRADRPRPEDGSSAGQAVSAAPHPSTFAGAQVIHQVTPAVPRDVRPRITNDVQVDVEVAIDAAGRVTGARIASTRGSAAGLLTIEAMKAAQLFRFRPAQRDGHNVPSLMVLTFDFAGTAR